MIVLKLIVKELGMRFWKIFNWLRLKSTGCYAENVNETSDFIKYGEFLDQLTDCHLKYIHTPPSKADLELFHYYVPVKEEEVKQSILLGTVVRVMVTSRPEIVIPVALLTMMYQNL
jgi:hypothetical protein